ncbi:lithostathine-1-alpha-like [Erythrolamprus reginae]|uniref:lithostathine-1-alpha-like n=1 Tax=Erythrolamprus reginae TaxID=121349 RepID=UPI00396CE8A5
MLLLTCFIFGLLGSLAWAGPQGRTVCPSGTFAYRDGSEWSCFKFYRERLIFEDAEEECQNRWKGHLASFNSERQAKSIAAYVAKENMESRFVWMGLQRDEDSDMITGWYWVDGSRSRFRKWVKGEPNGKTEYCATLFAATGHLTWVDLSCNYKFPFLCKWKPT